MHDVNLHCNLSAVGFHIWGAVPVLSCLPTPHLVLGVEGNQHAEGSSFGTSSERLGKPASIYMQIPFIPLLCSNWQSMKVIDWLQGCLYAHWLSADMHVFICLHVLIQKIRMFQTKWDPNKWKNGYLLMQFNFSLGLNCTLIGKRTYTDKAPL